jgi:hypothetical protein
MAYVSASRWLAHVSKLYADGPDDGESVLVKACVSHNSIGAIAPARRQHDAETSVTTAKVQLSGRPTGFETCFTRELPQERLRLIAVQVSRVNNE